jgi:hypothetical protein
MCILEAVRQLCDRLAEHREVPEQSVASITIGLDVGRRPRRGQDDEALDRVDDLREQDAVTLHERVSVRQDLFAKESVQNRASSAINDLETSSRHCSTQVPWSSSPAVASD